MNENELLLIRRSQKGDIDAFEELIRGYKKISYNIALRVLRNKEDAEDISQEALIKVFKNINSFNMQSTFKVWLYRIVMNTCLDHKRKKKLSTYSIDKQSENNTGEHALEIPDFSSNPDFILQNKLDKEVLYDSIDTLDDDFKNVIVLRDLHGLSYKEISIVLECNEGTIKSRLNRARKKLKELMIKNMFNS